MPRRVTGKTVTKPWSIPADSNPSLVSKTSEVGVIGSTYLDVKELSNNYRTLRFAGYGNVGDFSNGFSIALRVVPRFTGFCASGKGGFFTFLGAVAAHNMFARALSDGRFQFSASNADFSGMLNVVPSETYSFTSGTAVDIVFTWTGTTTTNAVKCYINGTLFSQGTASGAPLYSDAKGQLYGEILACLGTPQGDTSSFDLNELAIWNEVIDPTESGLALTGPARTTFIDSTPFDAMPLMPDPTDVLSGVEYGESLTGTYDPNDFWTDPGVENVLIDIEYLADGDDKIGELNPLGYTPDLRGFLDQILRIIGAPTLTDEEFGTFTIEEREYTVESYNQLMAVLDSRETVSNIRDRLTFYFQSRDVAVVAPPSAQSNIFIGSRL